MDALLALAAIRRRYAHVLDAIAVWRRIDRYKREAAERDRIAIRDSIVAIGREWSRTRDLDAAIEAQARRVSDSRLETMKAIALLDDLMRQKARSVH